MKVYRTPGLCLIIPMIQLRWLHLCTHYFFQMNFILNVSVIRQVPSTVLRLCLPFYLYRDIIIGCEWKRGLYEKKPIYLYILLFFSTVGTPNFSCFNLWSFKAVFELTDDFAKQLGLTRSRQGWLCDILWEISPTQSVSTNLFICFLILIALLATFYFLYEAGLLQHIIYGGRFCCRLLL